MNRQTLFFDIAEKEIITCLDKIDLFYAQLRVGGDPKKTKIITDNIAQENAKIICIVRKYYNK